MIEERNTRMVREEDDEMDDGEAGNSMDTRADIPRSVMQPIVYQPWPNLYFAYYRSRESVGR